MDIKSLGINRFWTLFLDRDGVVNKKIENGYVTSPEEFIFLPGVKDAIAQLSKIFGRILIITNQQGIGKGLYSQKTLRDIHKKMLKEISDAGGKIDDVFFCPHLAGDFFCNCRKPKTGLILQAKEKFPDINFSLSVLVGDSISDTELGKKLGMVTVKIHSKKDMFTDIVFSSLSQFSTRVVHNRET